MPRTTDHGERRAHIADALVRVAARDGLHEVTMRSVATEADVSLRLVQYYFQNKAQLLVGALRQLEQASNQRWSARLADLTDPPPPRAVVEAFLAEALPTDAASRAFHVVGASYGVLAMTDTDLAAQPFISGIDRLEEHLTEAMGRARAAGELAAGADPTLEATRLVMLSHGLGTSVLVGQRDIETARQVLDYHVAQLFDTSRSDPRD